MEENKLKTCGTFAAYRRHLRNNEKPCDDCKKANATYFRERRNKPVVDTPNDVTPIY